MRRRAVTLVELLVVVTLMVVLAGLAVAVSQSGVFGSQKVVSAGDRASGWLMIARQRALRDQSPRGVRFLLKPVLDPALNPGADFTYYASTEAQYIESPEPWVPNPAAKPARGRLDFVYWTDGTDRGTVPNLQAYRRIYFTSDDPADLAEFDQRVAVNDLILLPELKQVCRIKGIDNTTAAVTDGRGPHEARLLILENGAYPDLGANHSGPLPDPAPPAPQASRTTYQFGFQPAPRPLIGEPALQMPADSIVDCRMTPVSTGAVGLAAPNTTVGMNPVYDGAGYYLDVLFSPSGSVIGGTGGIVCLWVRDPSKTPHPRIAAGMVDDRRAFDAAGEQVLVTVYPHTGVVATHPPAWLAPFPNNDPYRYAKDGINSGL